MSEIASGVIIIIMCTSFRAGITSHLPAWAPTPRACPTASHRYGYETSRPEVDAPDPRPWPAPRRTTTGNLHPVRERRAVHKISLVVRCLSIASLPPVSCCCCCLCYDDNYRFACCCYCCRLSWVELSWWAFLIKVLAIIILWVSSKKKAVLCSTHQHACMFVLYCIVL